MVRDKPLDTLALPSSSSAALHHPTASCDQSIDHGQKPYPGHQALDPPHLIFSLPTTEGILSGFRYHPLSSTPSLAACTGSLDTESRFEGTSSGHPTFCAQLQERESGRGAWKSRSSSMEATPPSMWMGVASVATCPRARPTGSHASSSTKASPGRGSDDHENAAARYSRALSRRNGLQARHIARVVDRTCGGRALARSPQEFAANWPPSSQGHVFETSAGRREVFILVEQCTNELGQIARAPTSPGRSP
jgi:hypothetical protein